MGAEKVLDEIGPVTRLQRSPFQSARAAVRDFADAGLTYAEKWRGKTYVLVGKLGPQILYYNVRRFQEAGVATPKEQADKGTWTFDSFVQAAERLTNRRDTPPRGSPWESFMTLDPRRERKR